MPQQEVHHCQCPNCLSPDLHPAQVIHRQVNLLVSRLDEQQRRWYAAVEAAKLGHGGDRAVSRITGLHVDTIRRGREELAVFALAYNLVISVMTESARIRGVSVDRIGFLDASRWLTQPIPGGNPGDILVNPPRADRVEPRVIKRRMKQFPLMKEPRSVLRNRLLQKEVAA